MMCFGLKDRRRPKTNHCVIVLLDDTQLVHELHPTSTGQDLLDVVIKHLNLLETSYFGLKYYIQQGAALSSNANVTSGNNSDPSYQYSALAKRQVVWLDVEKSAIKQLKDVNPMTVHFGVKYYASDPCKLAEEITRYQFFLQCKQDIVQSHLPVSFELAVELFGLAIQSELGDYDPSRHRDGYVSEFSFVPNQTLELEQRAALFHRQHLVGQVPATAELNFLEKIKWLDMYGCEMHPIQYDEGDHRDQYALGLNPTGVLVLRNKLKVAQYLWSRIVKTKCQGRCFLMDVIDTIGPDDDSTMARQGLIYGKSKTTAGIKRNRFGFRLSDKEASQRLRWSIEEHKQFYYLLHSSSNLNHLALRQHQQQQVQAFEAAQMNLSQRFRNSIRSAINLGAHFNQQQQQYHQSQNQQLFSMQPKPHRSSVKSLNSVQIGNQISLNDRQPPTVVRMPSRRYSNRSLPRPSAQGYQLVAANGNGLPNPMSSTIVPGQRQQAMLMMAAAATAANQFNEQHHQYVMANKSQTLRPVSSREMKQQGSNAYYHQMMMMMLANQQQNRSNKQADLTEVSILPPGQHVVQPSVYRASSVIDGINQLGGAQMQQQQMARQQNHQPTMMQQLFNTKPQYPSQRGYESPRSTKSAMITGSALRMASKKLAKQQQQQQHYRQLKYADKSSDVRPLLEPQQIGLAQIQNYQDPRLAYANGGVDYYSLGAMSANASPWSARSTRLLSSASKSRSKSTGENLHMIHHQSANPISSSNRMLLATTVPYDQRIVGAPNLPPPDYNSSTPVAPQYIFQNQNQNQSRKTALNNANSNIINKSMESKNKINQNKRNQLRRDSSISNKQSDYKVQRQDDDADFYCSRSDCSSIDDGTGNDNRHLVKRAANRINANSRLSKSTSGNDPSQDWIKSKFSHDNRLDGDLHENNRREIIDLHREHQQQSERDRNNNDSRLTNQTIKNITNKQATPILLSMNRSLNENQTKSSANNKAVQLLNLQRQQLMSQTSDGDSNHRSNTTASGSDSNPVSEASSPKSPPAATRHTHNASDSTASNTSGYYAGSNSTGPASVDSDTTNGIGTGNVNLRLLANPQEPRHRAKSSWTPNSGLYSEGTRVEIALGAHANPAPARTGLWFDQQELNRQGQTRSINDRSVAGLYQGDKWTNLEHLQRDTDTQSSLKYVSFDV